MKLHRIAAEDNINRTNKLREKVRLMSTEQQPEENLSKEEMLKIMVNLYGQKTSIAEITRKLNARGFRNSWGNPVAETTVRQSLEKAGVLQVKRYGKNKLSVATVPEKTAGNLSKLEGVKAILQMTNQTAEQRIALALLMLG
jgi:hypothetical protein